MCTSFKRFVAARHAAAWILARSLWFASALAIPRVAAAADCIPDTGPCMNGSVCCSGLCTSGRCGDGGNANPTITSSPSPPSPFVVGSNGSFQVTALGYPPPAFSETGALPTNVTLSAAGLLSGTPAVNTGGTYPITIFASNGIPPDATQNFTLQVVTRAANYLAGYGLTGTNAALTFDYDRDGIPNLMEYALGLNPTVANRAGLPVVILKSYGGPLFLSMTFTRSAVATDLTYIVEGSPDLTSWSNCATSTAGGAMQGPGFVTERAVGTNFNVEVRDLWALDPVFHPKRFLRLRVITPP